MISPSDVLNIWDQEEAMGKKSISGSHDSSGSDFSFLHWHYGPEFGYFRDFYRINIDRVNSDKFQNFHF